MSEVTLYRGGEGRVTEAGVGGHGQGEGRGGRQGARDGWPR